MPRLVKGGKWAYGWAVVSPDREVTVPPEAWQEFGFHAEAEALFLPGSQRSGGFAVSTPDLMAEASERLGGGKLRLLGRGRFSAGGRLVLPPEVGAEPGARLLAVRGSRFGLGFVARGPVYDEALEHSELESFEVVVRNTDKATARSKADAIHALLDNLGPVTLSTRLYSHVTSDGTPAPLGQDENNRWLYVANYLARKARG